ncbi:MAG: LuxR C-terminal-related transcriptional regulator [Myxococcota bacterium]
MSEGSSLERRFRDLDTVLDRVNCGLVARDSKGIVIFVNERLIRWLGYTRLEMEGRPMEDFAPPELRDLVREEMRATASGDLRTRLAAVQRKDSTTFPVVIIPQRFLDSSGLYVGSFSVVVDLGSILTAKQVGYLGEHDLRASLSRIAMELQSISLTAGTPPSLPLHHPGLGHLSPREKEVLLLLVGGDRVPLIAERLHISQHTVRNHLKSMFRKLGVRTQSGLIQQIRSLVSPTDRPSQ